MATHYGSVQFDEIILISVCHVACLHNIPGTRTCCLLILCLVTNFVNIVNMDIINEEDDVVVEEVID